MNAPGQAITTTVPYDAPAVAGAQRQLEAELVEVAALTVIPDPDTYAAIDAFMSDVARRRDAIEDMRKRATGPMRKALDEIGAWFKPSVTAADQIIYKCKALMGAFQLARRAAEDEARALAAKAAESGDAQTMIDALTAASAAAAPVPEARASVGFRWVVKRIAEDLLPDEYWVPDRAFLDGYAASVKGEDEPDAIPGVVFERVTRIGARR